MNEEYLCNTCRIGKVRPIHFALNEAIIDCDNPSCESYLERWPDQCIISRSILNSTDLSKYERESTCSDSSGVHSDIGSSGVSQCSTDREVANFLYRPFSSNFDSQSYCTKELSNRSFLQWPFGFENQNQEPFVALDNNFTSPHEMSMPDQKIVLEDGICNEADDHNDVKNFDFFEMLKDDSHKILSENSRNSNSQLNLTNDLESWLNGLDSSTLLENKSGNDFENSKKNLMNGKFSSPSPSKPLRRSVHSAFSEVSPLKSDAKFNAQSSVESNAIKDEAKSLGIPNIFMSPASSGFNEDFSFNGDITILNKTLTDNLSPVKKNILNQTLFSDDKANFESVHLDLNTNSAPLSNNENEIDEPLFCKTENKFKAISIGASEENDELPGFKDTLTNAEVEDDITFRDNTDSKVPACDILSFNVPCHKIIEEVSCDKIIEGEVLSSHIKSNANATFFDNKLEDDGFQGRNNSKIQPYDTNTNLTSLSTCEKTDSVVLSREEIISDSTVKEIKRISNSSLHFKSEERKLPFETRTDDLRITPQPGNNLNIKPQKLQHSALQRKCRNQTRIKSDVAVDPWSVPEVYIDELNIEVVLSDSSSSGRRSNLKSPSNSIGGKKCGMASSRIDNDCETLSSQLNPRNSVDFSSGTNVQPEPVAEESVIVETLCLSPPKLDIYTPIILKPEVIESDAFCYFDSPLNISPLRLRRSVGYRGLDHKNDDIESDNNIESNNDDSIKSTYFSSVLSNINFDENFCKQENERPLEEAVSINYLDFESPNQGNSPSLEVDSPKHGIKLRYEHESEAYSDAEKNFEICSMDDIKGEDSDTEIPVVTVDLDANDDLQIFVPVKKEIKEEQIENRISNKNLLNISVDYSLQRRRKKRRKLEPQFEGSFGANSARSCDYDFTASNSTHCNVQREFFTLFNLKDNFGNIKKEPEHFNSLSDGLDCSDRFDAEDTCTNLFSLREDIIVKKEDCKSPPRKVKREKWSNMGSIRDPSVRTRDKDIVDRFDTKLAKPYFKSPSKRFRNPCSKGNLRKNKLSNTIQFLEENPSEPEILKFLRDLGWAVTPYDPTINSNVPEHPSSIVPSALQGQYGDVGSDFVYWSLTDKDVSLPEKLPLKKDASTNCSTKELKKKKLFDEDIRKKLSENKFSKSFKEAFSWEKNFANSPVSKITAKEMIDDEEIENVVNSKCLKSFKTKEGVTYFLPPYSMGTVSSLNEEEERGRDSATEDVDECIELPDDHLAYEEAKKSGFDVDAPPVLPQSIYIPPPSPRKLQPHPVVRPSVPPYLPPPPIEKSTLKAQNELKAIVSERPAKDVPDVVCMNIDGKLYVYHRKDS